MKSRIVKIQLVLFSLLIITFASIVNAATYSCGVSANDEWVLSVTKKNTDVIEEAYGNVDNWEQNANSIVYHYYSQNEAFHELGAKMKMKINGITEGETSWNLDVSFYDWVTGAFESPIDTVWTFPKNPEEMYWNTEVFFVATPVNTYLQNMNYITNYEDDASVSDNQVIVDFDGYIIYEVTYDSNDGRLTKLTMKYEDQVMYEISEGTGTDGTDDDGGGTDNGGTSIPGFDILLLIGITSIISAGLIKFVSKNKR
jgi:hypothetical protein